MRCISLRFWRTRTSGCAARRRRRWDGCVTKKRFRRWRKCVTDPEVEVRMAAVKGLKLLRTLLAAPALEAALNDTAAEVAGHAAHALRQLDWEPATPKIAAAWRVGLGEFDAVVAYGSEAVEPLVRLTKFAPFHLCIRAVEALSRTGDPQVVRPLLDCLQHVDDIRREERHEQLGVEQPEPAERPGQQRERDGAGAEPAQPVERAIAAAAERREHERADAEPRERRRRGERDMGDALKRARQGDSGSATHTTRRP